MNKMVLLKMLFPCHRLPERSFHIRGKAMPICARCTGITAGYVLAAGIALIHGAIGFTLSLALLIPGILDGTIQMLTRYRSTNVRRVVSGLAMGVGIVFLLYHYLAFGFEQGIKLGQYLFT